MDFVAFHSRLMSVEPWLKLTAGIMLARIPGRIPREVGAAHVSGVWRGTCTCRSRGGQVAMTGGLVPDGVWAG